MSEIELVDKQHSGLNKNNDAVPGAVRMDDDFVRRPNVSKNDKPTGFSDTLSEKPDNSKLSVCALVKDKQELKESKILSFFPSEINMQTADKAKSIKGGRKKQNTVKKRRKKKQGKPVCRTRISNR